MVTLVSLVQPSNAPYSIEVTLDGISMFFKLVQPENAENPIEVTLDGMEMLVSPVQPLNAEPTICLIPSGMLYSPEKFLGMYANIEELKTGAVSLVQP